MKYFIYLCFITGSVFAQTVDSIAIKQVDSLIKVSRDLSAARKFNEALELMVLAEKIALAKIGRMTVLYGSCCHNLGKIFQVKGNFEETEKWYLEAIEIRKKVLGAENLDYAWSLNNLGLLYMDNGNYKEAEILLLQVLKIRDKCIGKEHPDYAWCLHNLANIYTHLGNYKNAEIYYLETKTIREKILGKENSDYAQTLHNLASVYYYLANYKEAETINNECKTIREKILGKENIDYAWSLHNLAIIYHDLCNYEKAEKLLLECKSIREKLLGREHMDYALTLNNLGNLYKATGNYEKAELLYLDCKVIQEKVMGIQHPDYAGSLSNLAYLYKLLGNYEKAEFLYLESETLFEKLIGKENTSYALLRCNHALLYMEMNNYDKSELLYLDSKTILENLVGRNHPAYVGSLVGLANLYTNMGNYEKAETLYLETQIIDEKNLGSEHPDYASNLHNLAVLYCKIGKFKEAEKLYLRSKSIMEKVIGKEDPDYTTNLRVLSKLYENQMRYAESDSLLVEFFKTEQTRLAKSVSFLSEHQLAQYKSTFQTSEEMLNSYILHRNPNSVGILPSLAYGTSLFYKGFLLNAAVSLNQLKFSTVESELANQYLKGYRQRLSLEYTKPISERKNIIELESKVDSTEKVLARTLAGYADALKQFTWQDVETNLKIDEAAIEFINFKVNFPKETDSTMYGALILLSSVEEPIFIPLFEVKQLVQLLSDNESSQSISELYSSRGATPIKSNSFQGLYELIWKPLDSILKDVKIINYSPSGLLHRINFDAIQVNTKTNLSDKYRLVRLGSTRSLAIPDLTKIDSSNQVMLFGGIDYNIDTTMINLDTMSPEVFASKDEELSFTYAERGISERENAWGNLPGTESEINGVSKLFKKSKFSTTAFSGKYATEESFKNLGRSQTSPRVLHIATHGFFFPDPKSNSQESGVNSQTESVFKMSDHPMIRSGLILAGGNYAWKEGKPFKEGVEDGILTAYEISQMNLSNTELVVLSACETGLGDIQGNEGVYGLQRAFKIAGAKYLIMSLWQVPDKQTSLLMTTFYKKWLEDKMMIPEAFHAAQKELRDIGLDPYQWAGFVLVE